MSEHVEAMRMGSSKLVGGGFDKEHRAPNKLYCRAILQALESFRDFQSRSNLDSVRRHTKAILEHQEHHFRWNDTIFLKAIKSVAQNGDIDLCANIQAELSPTYKRKRADSLSQRMSLTVEVSMPPPPPPYPILPVPVILNLSDFSTGHRNRKPSKEPPKRTREHDKWKVTSKRVYESLPVVNPMDTH